MPHSSSQSHPAASLRPAAAPAVSATPRGHAAAEGSASAAWAARPVRCMVFKVSDSRTMETDEGGAYAVQALAEQGHSVVSRQIVADEVPAIRAQVLDAVESGTIDVLVLTGGTSLGPRDVTPDAVVPLFSKRMPGFGEILRQISFNEMGPSSLLSRADAGVITRTLVFILPGSPSSVRLAMNRLIGPILGPALALITKPH
jgi:molybdenum cofactor biosynthesis protein B